MKILTKMAPSVIRAEMSGATETGKQIRAAGPLPPVSIVVISHGKPAPNEPGFGQMWAALQQDLAAESSRSTHIIARKSRHNIQGDEPEMVIQVIKDLVMQARQGNAIPQ